MADIVYNAMPAVWLFIETRLFTVVRLLFSIFPV